MKGKSKPKTKSVSKTYLPDSHVLSYVFLGVGITIFILNLASLLSFMPKAYSYVAFDVSVFASIVIILFSAYHLTTDKN